LKRVVLTAFLLAFAAAGEGPVPALGATNSVIVVLSSNGGPYKEALEGFQEAWGQPVTSYALSEGVPHIPGNTRIVVAIGGKAAVYPFLPAVPLVYCLAPGVSLDSRPGDTVEVRNSPEGHVVMLQLKSLQPSLRRLGILWASPQMGDYVKDAEKNDSATGVKVLSVRLETVDELPGRLRELIGKVDALWIPPDPLLVTPEAFATLKGFSNPNGIPFYASGVGLIGYGPVAAIYSSFHEVGRLAADAARKTLEGSEGSRIVYPQKARFAVDLTAIKETRASVDQNSIGRADKVVP
jgi:hypothetical protein